MNIKYKIINHHSPNHTSEGQVCRFGFHVLLFFVYTSCSAVVPVNLVLLFPRLTLHPQGWGWFHLTCLWSAINCRYWDSPQCQRLLLAPHGTASWCSSCYSSRLVFALKDLWLTCSCPWSLPVPRSQTNWTSHLTPWPHALALFVSKYISRLNCFHIWVLNNKWKFFFMSWSIYWIFLYCGSNQTSSNCKHILSWSFHS